MLRSGPGSGSRDFLLMYLHSGARDTSFLAHAHTHAPTGVCFACVCRSLAPNSNAGLAGPICHHIKQHLLLLVKHELFLLPAFTAPEHVVPLLSSGLRLLLSRAVRS